MILLIYGWIPFACTLLGDICIHVYQWYWFVILFFCDIWVWFWLQSDGGLLEWAWYYPCLCNFLSSLRRRLFLSHEVMSHSLWSHRLEPFRLLCPWDFPERILLWVALLLKGIFQTQRLNSHLLIRRWILYHWATGETLKKDGYYLFSKCLIKFTC